MIYNLTDLTNVAVQNSTIIANKYSDMVNTEHVLFGLASVVESKASKLLSTYKVSTASLEEIFASSNAAMSRSGAEYSPRTKEMFYIANSISKKLNQTYISTEHLLLALLSQTDSYAVQILAGMFKLNIHEMRNKLISIMNASHGTKDDRPISFDGFVQVGNVPYRAYNGESKTATTITTSTLPSELLEIGKDITLRAREGKIDPVIGRSEEIERIIEVLCRKTKNNPVLIGEAGVGKSAIVEGLALKIVRDDVPMSLRNKTIFSLDIGGLMAGTKYRGALEEKLKNTINTILNDKNIIVFIDEIHTLAMAGSDKGETSPADMLKPYLARGEMQTIGATTTDEYRKHIEQDKALERRFQPIMVNPPSISDTIEILTGLKESYESFHKVKISQEAIKAAVIMSDKYIPDRSLPDKAIDLIDMAASRAKVKNDYAPKDDIERQKRLSALESSKQDAVMQDDFEKASALRDEIIAMKNSIQVKTTQDERLSDVTIGEAEIAEVVSKWTQIPVTKLTQSEADKLLLLEEKLSKRVIGQQEAIIAVSKAIRRSRIGIRDSKRPIGSFMFLGSTGVGKTELSKALADALYDNENNMIRLDMSEYMESHSVSKLIGAPPGYVGFDDGGQLTEQVRRKPYSIVLFDEIEKSHPDVLNILLQVLDDGRLTDTHGRIVSFKNCIIIMTSNVGGKILSVHGRTVGFNDTKGDNNDALVLDELKRHFRPEFINRIDSTVIFHKLSADNMYTIAKNMLVNVNSNLREKGLRIKLTIAAVNYLVLKGSSDEYGARPLRRLITNEIEDELADMYLKGEVSVGGEVIIDCDGNRLIFTKKIG